MKLINSLMITFTVARMACALPEFIPIQERAQGHSLVGAAQFNESTYSNPAAASFVQVYSVEGSMMQGGLAASIVDTKTSYIGGTLGYYRQDETAPSGPLQSLRVGFSRKITDAIAIGTMGKTIWNNNARLNDADIGMLARFLPIEIGIVTRNVLGGNVAVADQRREIAYGARLGFKDALFFSASTTAIADQPTSPYEYGFGAEFISLYYFSIKGGYRVERIAQQSHWSAGISLLSPRLLAHYAVEFANTPEGTSTHQVALSMLF